MCQDAFEARLQSTTSGFEEETNLVHFLTPSLTCFQFYIFDLPLFHTKTKTFTYGMLAAWLSTLS